MNSIILVYIANIFICASNMCVDEKDIRKFVSYHSIVIEFKDETLIGIVLKELLDEDIIIEVLLGGKKYYKLSENFAHRTKIIKY